MRRKSFQSESCRWVLLALQNSLVFWEVFWMPEKRSPQHLFLSCFPLDSEEPIVSRGVVPLRLRPDLGSDIDSKTPFLL